MRQTKLMKQIKDGDAHYFVGGYRQLFKPSCVCLCDYLKQMTRIINEEMQSLLQGDGRRDVSGYLKLVSCLSGPGASDDLLSRSHRVRFDALIRLQLHHHQLQLQHAQQAGAHRHRHRR